LLLFSVFPNVIDEFLLSCVHARDGNLEAVARQVRLVERLAGADSIYAHRSVNVLLAACILRAASKSASSSIDTARVQVVLTHMRQRCLPVDAEVLLRLMRELIAAHRIQDACAYLTKIIEWNIIPLDSKPVDSTSSWIDSAAFALIRSLVQPGNSQSQDDASHLNQRAAAAQFVLRNLPPVSNPSNRASQKSSHNSAFFALLNQHVSTDAAQASVKSAFPPFVATASLHQSDTSMHFALESPTSSASLSFSSDVSISAAFDSSTSAACLQNVSLTLRPRDSALPVNALDFVQASRTRLYNTCAALFIRHQLGDVAAWLMTAVSAASPQLLNSYSVSSLVDALITSHQHRLGRLPLIELVQRHVQTMQALSIEPECSSTSQLAKSRSRELRGSAAQLRAAAFARGPLALASIFAQLSLQSSKLAALQPSDEFGNTRAFLRAVDTRLVERLLSNAAAAGDLPSAQRLWSALLRACKSDTMPIDLSATMFSNLLMAHVRGGQIAAAASWLYRSAQALRQAPVELTTEQRLLHACRPDTFTLNTLMAHVLDSNSSTTTEKVPMPVLADDSVDSTFDWSTLSMTSTTESSDVTFAPSPQRNTISAEMPLPLTNISSSAAVQNRSVESVTSPAVGKSAAVKPVRNRLTADLLGLSDTAASIAQPLHCIIPLFSALLPSSQVAAAATASVFLSQQSATTVDNNALSLAACLHKASSNDVLGRQSRLERVFRVLTSAPFNGTFICLCADLGCVGFVDVSLVCIQSRPTLVRSPCCCAALRLLAICVRRVVVCVRCADVRWLQTRQCSTALCMCCCVWPVCVCGTTGDWLESRLACRPCRRRLRPPLPPLPSHRMERCLTAQLLHKCCQTHAVCWLPRRNRW
jgi:hypothetical protein